MITTDKGNQGDQEKDPHNLGRFMQAQARDFEQALAELRNGRKVSHWMWYLFPQLEGLAFSSTSRHYAIKGAEEAKAYLNHPVLGLRLVQCVETVLHLEGLSATDIFGTPDDLKLRSCATLFAAILPPGSVFELLLKKYYPAGRDERTLQLLGME